MSIYDVLEVRPEAAAGPGDLGGDTREAPGWWETAGAQAEVMMDEGVGAVDRQRRTAYAPVVEALAELGQDRSRYLIDLGTGDFQWNTARIWRDIANLPADQRANLGIPDNQAAFDEQWQAEFDEIMARDEDTASRGPVTARLAGGLVTSFGDPLNVMTLPAGGHGKYAATKIISEALVQMGVEGLQQPLINLTREAQGRDPLTGEQMAINIGAAGLFGGAVRGAVELGPGAARGASRQVRRAADAAGDKAAEFLPEDIRLARAMGDAMPDHIRTPEQQAAMHILTRDGEIEASSPFTRTYEGIDAHAGEIRRVMDDLAAEPKSAAAISQAGARSGPNSPASAGSLNPQILQFFEQKGYSRALARGIAAGIEAESRSNPAIVNPTSGAFGIGQWLGPRQKELFRRYGRNPTMEQQLEFLHWELQGGDHGGARVLAQAEESAALRSYIEDFMRPAKGAETIGDMERGMAALGRDGEAAGAGGAVDAGDIAPAAAARFPDAQAQRQMIDGPDAADLFDDIPASPQLQRDLFDSEASWRIAQSEFAARQAGVEPAVTRQTIWEEARDLLLRSREGEVRGALHHRDIGPINVKWGNAKGGLAHIAADHADVLDRLPALLDEMAIYQRSANRIRLESDDARAVVRLDWDGQQENWLLTAFRRDDPPARGGSGDELASPAAEDGGAAIAARDRSPARETGSDIGSDARAGKADSARLTVGNVARSIRSGELPDGFTAGQVERFTKDNEQAVQAAVDAGDLPAGRPVQLDRLTAAERDLAEADGQLGFTFDEAASARFDEPDGDGVQSASESLWHDIRADGEGRMVDLDDGKGARSAAEIDAELKAEEDALAALRACVQ